MEGCWKALRKCAREKREDEKKDTSSRQGREPLPGVGSKKKKDLMTREGRVQAPDRLQQHTRIRLPALCLFDGGKKGPKLTA